MQNHGRCFCAGCPEITPCAAQARHGQLLRVIHVSRPFDCLAVCDLRIGGGSSQDRLWTWTPGKCLPADKLQPREFDMEFCYGSSSNMACLHQTAIRIRRGQLVGFEAAICDPSCRAIRLDHAPHDDSNMTETQPRASASDKSPTGQASVTVQVCKAWKLLAFREDTRAAGAGRHWLAEGCLRPAGPLRDKLSKYSDDSTPLVAGPTARRSTHSNAEPRCACVLFRASSRSNHEATSHRLLSGSYEAHVLTRMTLPIVTWSKQKNLGVSRPMSAG